MLKWGGAACKAAEQTVWLPLSLAEWCGSQQTLSLRKQSMQEPELCTGGAGRQTGPDITSLPMVMRRSRLIAHPFIFIRNHIPNIIPSFNITAYIFQPLIHYEGEWSLSQGQDVDTSASKRRRPYSVRAFAPPKLPARKSMRESKNVDSLQVPEYRNGKHCSTSQDTHTTGHWAGYR